MAEFYVGRKFRTEFVSGVKDDEGRIPEILSVGKALDSMGLTPENSGNISVRTKKGMLITIGGKNKATLTVDDVVEVVSFDGDVAKVVGSTEPSSETPMHWLIYQTYDKVNAVVHAHDQKVLEKADLLSVPVTDHFVNYGTRQQAKQVAKALRKSSFIVIREHGIVSAGTSLKQAMLHVVEYHEKAIR